MTAKKFKNWTAHDFSWKFDNVVYEFPSGIEMFLEDYKAEHFANHLVDEEMNRMGIPTNQMHTRQTLMSQCFPSNEVLTPLEALNIEMKEKAEVKKVAKAKKDEEFPDLMEELPAKKK